MSRCEDLRRLKSVLNCVEAQAIRFDNEPISLRST